MRATQTYGPSSGFANPFRSYRDPSSKLTAEELRAEVEAAKQTYKARKAAYRLEREARRRERGSRRETGRETGNDTTINPPSGTVPPPVSEQPDEPHIVSNANGKYPQVELYTVRRANTLPAHGSKKSENKPEDLLARARARIAKRLSDMGFSETSHPTLPDKIKAQMPSKGTISKEEEDDVVTTLLEELLAMSPRSPVASGSGRRNNDLTGTWH